MTIQNKQPGVETMKCLLKRTGPLTVEQLEHRYLMDGTGHSEPIAATQAVPSELDQRNCQHLVSSVWGENENLVRSLDSSRNYTNACAVSGIDSRLDTNGDGHISASDALAVINQLSRTPDPNESDNSRFDTNGDGQIEGLDALIVINQLGLYETQQQLTEPTEEQIESWRSTATLMAGSFTSSPLPDPELIQTIAEDLARVRWSHPDTQLFAKPSSRGMVNVKLIPEASKAFSQSEFGGLKGHSLHGPFEIRSLVDAFTEGNFRGLDALDQLGPLYMSLLGSYPDGRWISLYFEQPWDAQYLVEILEQVDGVQFAEQNGSYGTPLGTSYLGTSTTDGETIRTYRTDLGHSDCPSGCLVRWSVTIHVGSDQVIRVEPDPIEHPELDPYYRAFDWLLVPNIAKS